MGLCACGIPYSLLVQYTQCWYSKALISQNLDSRHCFCAQIISTFISKPIFQNKQAASKSRVEYRSYEQLKEDFDELNLKMETDLDILIRLMSQYKATSSDVQRAVILEDLEYLVHQFDNAINFIDMGRLSSIILIK